MLKKSILALVVVVGSVATASAGTLTEQKVVTATPFEHTVQLRVVRLNNVGDRFTKTRFSATDVFGDHFSKTRIVKTTPFGSKVVVTRVVRHTV